MDWTESDTYPVSEQDVGLLIGVVAVLAGAVHKQRLDDDSLRSLITRFDREGLWDPGDGDEHTSNALLRIALLDLVERLRYAHGEYDTAPTPIRRATAHVLDFAARADADACRDLVAGEAEEVLVRREDVGPRGAWRMYATYPELAPGPGFDERARQLRELATCCHGRYAGHQEPPQMP